MTVFDLNTLTNDWPYEPGRLAVRKVIGKDGAIRIQMRMDLGVAQLEYSGRPDGRRPYTCTSILEFHHRRLEQHFESCGSDMGFVLAPQECAELREELALYYQRYLCLFVLEELDRVAGDVEHGLAIIAFCERYTHNEVELAAVKSFRPYLLLMHARALALAEINHGRMDKAMEHVNSGLFALYGHFRDVGRPAAYATAPEVEALEQLRLSLGDEVEADRAVHLRRLLRIAVREERYEDAARLRDALLSANTSGASPGS